MAPPPPVSPRETPPSIPTIRLKADTFLLPNQGGDEKSFMRGRLPIPPAALIQFTL